MTDFTGKKLISESILSDVANAIRERMEISDKIPPSKFAEHILSIGINYYSSWRGLISPMDGTFQQAYYNNGVAVGDKIYFMRNYGHSHYNGDNIDVVNHTRWFCYDTTNNTTTYSVPTCDGENFYCSSMWLGSDGAIYGFGYPYRYKTIDFGVTWARETMTTPQYDPCPVYKLSNGRIIGTMLARTKMLMISDDDGLTWETVTPFTNEDFETAGITGYISMSHGTICELSDCLALYFNSPLEESSNLSRRYVSLSYDNGDSWSLPVACSGELGEAGWYVCPGGMVHFRGRYHYFVSCRYTKLKYTEDENYYVIGDLKWFTGTADDVKNGTMTLRDVLSQTLCTTYDFDNVMARQDVGNSGVTLCNGSLYINHGNLVYNKDDATRTHVSNSGIEMFRVGANEEADAAPYWDADFSAKYEEMLSKADTSYNYYFYSPANTNIKSVDWWGYENTGYVPNEGTFKLPLGSGNFEIHGIYHSSWMELGRSYPSIYAGIEEPDGTLHALGASGTKKYAIFDKANDASVVSGVLPGGTTSYFTFKRKDGVYTFTVNGVTVTDPPFGWTLNTDAVTLGVSETSYIYNINASDDVVQAWIDTAPYDWKVSGLSMLVVSCDADYHGTERDYSVTYNLTGCSSTNTKVGVNAGKSYNTTISVNTGYELSGDIVCTMGGVAQTVTDGVISIESVTGDIVITATATENSSEPVTDGLTMCYAVATYNADTNTWVDECGIGTTVTGSAYEADRNMVSCSNLRLLNMSAFSSMFESGWTLSVPCYISSTANYLFALNSVGAASQIPYSTPKQFYEADGNTITLSNYIAKGETHHLTWTYDPEQNEYAAYVDGELIGKVSKTTAWETSTSKYFMIGGWGHHFGDVRVYNRALTADEVTQNFVYDSKSWTFDV